MRAGTKKKLAEIRARLEAAAPGPWEGGEDVGGVNGFLGVVDANGRAVFSSTETVAVWPDPNGPAVFDPQELADVEFIANAPTDVRYLLALLDKTIRHYEEVERRLAEHDEWRSWDATFSGGARGYIAALEADQRKLVVTEQAAAEATERAEDAERKLAALCARGLRVVQLASDDDPEVWPAADSLGAFIADVAPVAERHDRAVRVKELRRLADGVEQTITGAFVKAWLRDEADRIERGGV